MYADPTIFTNIKCLTRWCFSCDQAPLRTLISVCLSLRLSHLFDNVPLIVGCWSFQELLPMTDVFRQKVKVRGQRSRSQRSWPHWAVFGRIVIPVWIHILRWNYAQILMMLRRGAMLFLKVIRQISRSHGTINRRLLTQIGRFRTVTPIWINWWILNDGQSLM